MSKELFKVTHVKDGILDIETDFGSDDERLLAATAIQSLMERDEMFANLLIESVGAHIRERMEVENQDSRFAGGELKSRPHS